MELLEVIRRLMASLLQKEAECDDLKQRNIELLMKLEVSDSSGSYTADTG